MSKINNFLIFKHKIDYEKELSRIRKLLEEENCSDNEKNDKNGFSSDTNDEKNCPEDVHVPNSDNCMSDCENLQARKKRSQNLLHGLEKIKQHGGGKTHLRSMGILSIVILSNLDKDYWTISKCQLSSRRLGSLYNARYNKFISKVY